MLTLTESDVREAADDAAEKRRTPTEAGEQPAHLLPLCVQANGDSVTTTERQHDGQPVLDGFIERHRQGNDLRVWCRWCCHWHTHGLTGKPGDYLHRSPHCHAPDSRYRDTGYVIRVTATPFSRVRQTLKQASVPQRSAIYCGRISAAVQRLRDQPLPVGEVPEATR